MAKATRDTQDAFIEAYRKIGTIRAACDAIGINRAIVLRWRDGDVQGFRQRFEDADLDFTEALEAVAHNRAVNGSDNLLMFTLKKRKPEYRENMKIEHSGKMTLEQLVHASIDPTSKS